MISRVFFASMLLQLLGVGRCHSQIMHLDNDDYTVIVTRLSESPKTDTYKLCYINKKNDPAYLLNPVYMLRRNIIFHNPTIYFDLSFESQISQHPEEFSRRKYVFSKLNKNDTLTMLYESPTQLPDLSDLIVLIDVSYNLRDTIAEGVKFQKSKKHLYLYQLRK